MLIHEIFSNESTSDKYGNWDHEQPANYSKHLEKTFGEPDEITDEQTVWQNIDGFKRVVVRDEYILHGSPAPHYDFIYCYIDLEVPENLSDELAKCSGSILIDHLKNEVGARCGSLTANATTLNFVIDVVAGRVDPVKEEYESRILGMKQQFKDGERYELDWWPDESGDADPKNPFYAEDIKENLRAWFGKGKKGGAGRGGWNRYNTKGERIGKCGDAKKNESTLNEYRNALYDFVKSKFPTWPEYVLKDFLYSQTKHIRDEQELKDFLERNQKDFGQVKWRLEKLPITLDIFTPKTQRMIKERAGGSSNPYQVPKDAERHAQQLKMIQQQGVRTEPIIVAKLNNGYDLIEGWHRTIQHLQQYPEGYTGPAWVAYGATYTSESKQGVKENLRDWFGKGKKGGAGGGGWDRYNTKGERIGKCGDAKKSEGKPKCLSKSRAASLRAKGGKKAIAAAVNKKRRDDPNKNRTGKAKNVSNTVKTRKKK